MNKTPPYIDLTSNLHRKSEEATVVLKHHEAVYCITNQVLRTVFQEGTTTENKCFVP